MSVRILVGTRKGLFTIRADAARRSFTLEAPQLAGWEVMHAVEDPRDGTLFAATASFVYGPTVQRSTDGGETWARCEQVGLPDSFGSTLEKLWHVRPGHADRPAEVWLGGAPGVLFRSADGGASFEPVDAILAHPTRDRWHPGAGGMCCHSIQIDSADPDRLYVAISAAGAFRSDDGGATFTPANRDVAADFLADPRPEVGQCVHKLLAHPARPERLWQQNHCGVYRSDDRGTTWQRLDRNGLPGEFGFPIMVDPHDPDTALVIPEEGPMNRVTSGGRLGVYRTRDAGATWHLASGGLPESAYSVILREASAFDRQDPAGVYFGTQGGTVYASADTGDTWAVAAEHLPPILSVEVAEVEP